MQENINNNPMSLVTKPRPSMFSEYAEALKAGFLRVWANKWLWFWGFLLPAGGGFGFNSNFGGSGNFGEEDKEKIKQMGVDPEMMFQTFWQNYGLWILLGIGILILLGLVCWIISAIARSGVIQALDEMQDPSRSLTFNFGKVWQAGKKNFGRVLGIDLLIGFGLLLILALIGLPIALLFAQKTTGAMVVGAMLAILAVLVFILLSLVAIYLKNMATIEVVLADGRVVASVGRSYRRLLKNIKEALLLLVFRIILGIVFALALVMAIFALIIVGSIIAIPAVMIAKANPGSELLVGIVAGSFWGLILFFVILVAKAIAALWQMDLWVWWMRRIAGLKKTEEKKEEAVVKREPVMEEAV